MEHERCDACGFNGAGYDNASLLAALQSLGQRWRYLLSEKGPELHQRPEPEVWSAIEYAAHSRDVTALHAFGVEQALTLDEPSYPPIGDDLAESVAASYRDADPDLVLDGLEEQAARLAQLADDAGHDRWSRGLTIGGDRSDVRRLLEHALHDSLHHVDDVERGLARLRGSRPRLLMPMPQISRVVVLNGASSAGKTTIATGFREQRAAVGDFWLLTGIDDFLAKLPAEWMSGGPDHGAFSADGVRFERTPEGVTVRVGRVGRQLLRAYQAGVAAAARVGLNVIVDEVVIDKTSWDDWVVALAGVEVVWVGIRCSADVAEERNRVRGDRFLGLARAQTATAHLHARYDFEIDTTTQTSGDAVRELTRRLGI